MVYRARVRLPVCTTGMISQRLTQQVARDLLTGAELERDEWAKLRRRVEDCLRKSPASLLDVAAWLAAEGWIRIDDLI